MNVTVMGHRKRNTKGENAERSQSGGLPSTHHDALASGCNGNSSPSHGMKERRRISSVDKKAQFLLRSIGGCMLTGVVVLYVLATRHVVLHSTSGRSGVDPTLRTETYKMNEARVLFQPIPFFDAGSRRPPPVSPFSKKPRKVGYFYGNTNSSSFVGIELKDLPLPDNAVTRIRRQTQMTAEDMKRQTYLKNSKDYRKSRADTMADMGRGCVAQYPWQESFYPTCNNLMELDITESLAQHQRRRGERAADSSTDDEIKDTNNGLGNVEEGSTTSRYTSTSLSYLSCGYWRDVWQLKDERDNDEPELFVFKTQRYEHDFTGRNFDRHRRDAVTSERLTSSPFIMDIYGFCGTSGLFEFADRGSLEDAIWDSDKDVKPWSPKERVVVSYQVAAALSAVHNYPKEGVPAIAHTDITTGQYVYVEKAGSFRLQDFNRARFIAWNNKTNSSCTYEIGNNPGNLRSPEEYAYGRQTEKVDVYSMGNVLYSILTSEYPFKHEKYKDVCKKVIAGERPAIPKKFLNSTDPFDQTMLKAIEMCWVHDPEKRATAREVQRLFISTLKKMNVKSGKSEEKEQVATNSSVNQASALSETI